MNRIVLILVFIFNYSLSYSQNYLGYSNDTLNIASSYLKKAIDLNLHLPETHAYSAEDVKYPVIIIFDSQHEFTYPHLITSIDLLTNESQIPESIVIGVPFDYQNRTYFTSSKQQDDDPLMGIERMEEFLFTELIPQLEKNYKANDFITIIGHSRTAFLVNYLVTTKSEQIDIAIALSGFYTNKPISTESFQNFISNDHFPNPIHYYFTAGNSLEEKTYLTECKDMATFIKENELAQNFKSNFSETPYANHVTNYWMSLPPILVDAFKDYSYILNDWLHQKLEQDDIKSPVTTFKEDIQKLGKNLGYEINPDLTQIYSIASAFAFQKNDLKTAINFLEIGQKYYPNYLDFDLQIISFYQELKDEVMIKYHKEEYIKKLNDSGIFSEEEKVKRLEYINE